MSRIKCRQCAEDFKDLFASEQHQRLVHQQKLTIKIGDGTIPRCFLSKGSHVIIERIGGVFSCSTCHNFSSPNPKATAKHFHDCRVTLEIALIPNDGTKFTKAGLVFDDYHGNIYCLIFIRLLDLLSPSNCYLELEISRSSPQG
jgi:hypothetical protein